jgi:hypothetical protein
MHYTSPLIVYQTYSNFSIIVTKFNEGQALCSAFPQFHPQGCRAHLFLEDY